MTAISLENITQSILDNDFYKFTMQHAVVKLFPKAKARYQFINRGEHIFPEGFGQALRKLVDEMGTLKLSTIEKQFLDKNCPYFDPTYLDFLQGYRYDPSEVEIRQEGSALFIEISGYWYRSILWEVPLLFLICELYYRMSPNKRVSDAQVQDIAFKKMEKYKALGVRLAEFGTRRRHSYRVQELTVETLQQYSTQVFNGTSNVHLAMKYQTRPIGTHAHEWFMFHAAKYGYKMSNSLGLEHWSQVYRGDLGIALSDTYTSAVFFDQFDKKFTKLFDGVRHDSGDPLAFAQKAIEHYQHYGIDPLSKSIIFSDGLNYDKVARIAEFCRDKIGFSFGIGTNFTNDLGLKPMNIVIKMQDALPEDGRWTPVVKLSDEPEKHTGTEDAIALAKQVLEIQA